MKTKYLPLTGGLLLVFACLAFYSCKKAAVSYPEDLGRLVFAGTGSANQLVPAGTSKGTATFLGVYDANLQVFNIKLSWKDLDSTLVTARFYGPNAAGQSYAALRDIYVSTTVANNKPRTDSLTFAYGGAAAALNALSQRELNDLKAGKWYYLITTPSSPTGVLRGQITFSNTLYK